MLIEREFQRKLKNFFSSEGRNYNDLVEFLDEISALSEVTIDDFNCALEAYLCCEGSHARSYGPIVLMKLIHAVLDNAEHQKDTAELLLSSLQFVSISGQAVFDMKTLQRSEECVRLTEQQDRLFELLNEALFHKDSASESALTEEFKSSASGALAGAMSNRRLWEAGNFLMFVNAHAHKTWVYEKRHAINGELAERGSRLSVEHVSPLY